MNFIDRQHEPMPEGAAQSHEQPMVEKSIADALVARAEQLETILTGFHTDTQCGSCKGPLEEERDAICKRCTMESDNERLTQENAALRELVERQQLGLDEAYKLMPYLHQYVSDGTELDGMVQLWLDNYEAMKRGAK